MRFLGAIKEAQAVGFTLAEIAEYLRAARRSGAPSEALRVRMAAKIDQIDARIAALRRMRDELARVVGCACASLDHCTCGAAYLARRGGAPTARPSLLHITNGESAGNTLRQTALGGAVLPWQDVLHEGPVPALPRQKLLRTRARFLADCGWGRPAGAALIARAARPAAARGAPRRPPGRALVRARPLRPAPAPRRARARPRRGGRARADRHRLLPRQAVVRRSGRADGERARDALALPPPGGTGRARGGHERLGRRPGAGADGTGRVGDARDRGSCRSSPPRCGGCSRSCPRRQTGSRGRNDGRSRRSPPARARLPPPSSQRNGSRRRPSSATPGSTEPSPHSGRERRGSSRPTTAHRFPRRLRSATASPSHDSSCG